MIEFMIEMASEVATIAETAAEVDNTGWIVGLCVGIPLALLVGAACGYFIAMKLFKKQMKKNPPISKDTIRSIYRQVGRQPSEKQVNEIYSKVVKSN
ncbi:MAG: YneF family protein [Mycoplasma sp.]